MKKLSSFVLMLFLATFVSTLDAQQVRLSQRGTVSQFVADTEISIVYNRPVARGRVLFGSNGLEKFDKIWMPGANEASVITINKPVLVNGKRLEAGSYSIWTIPGEKEWTVIFNSKTEVWHTNYPEGFDVLRVSAMPQDGGHMEVMSFYFPMVSSDSAILRFHWGKTIVPVEIKLSK